MKTKIITKQTLTFLTLFILFIQTSCNGQDNTNKATDKAQTMQSDTMTYEEKLIQVNQKVSEIKVGTTREEIEKIFHQEDVGLQGACTRYYEEPEVMIEIPYDITGGAWSKQNKVNGPIKVYKSKMHMDYKKTSP